MIKKAFFFVLLLFLLNLYVKGQTCCSGGVPISNSLGLPFSSKSSFQASVSYDYHNLNTLFQEKERLEDKSRERETHTSLIQLGTVFNNGLSFETLIPYIIQERKIATTKGTDIARTSGLGDVLGLVNYQKQIKYSILSVGIGLKAPTGSIDNRNSLGILLNADLQPGTGSWDVLPVFRWVRSLKNKPNTSIYSTVIAALKGTDKEYQQGLSYKFGNEQQLTVGLSSQQYFLKSLWNTGVGLRFRNVQKNETNGQTISSTGGRWLLLNGNIGYWLIPEKSNLTISADIPVYNGINGLQNVPTYRLNCSIYCLLNYKEKKK